MKREFLENGDIVIATMAYLRWNDSRMDFDYIGIDSDSSIYRKGVEVQDAESEHPFFEYKGDAK